MNATLTKAQAIKHILALRKGFPTFESFIDVYFKRSFGFDPTWLQKDIATFMSDQTNPFRMVQSQRGEAKSSLAMLYVIWRFIHDTDLLVLLISSEGKNSSNLGTGISSIIRSDKSLACLIPTGSDREGTAIFDINGQVATRFKDPSFTSISIGGSFQSKRADLVVCDDISSFKNSDTAAKVERLEILMSDFPNLQASRPIEILYLGTPQSTSSPYNILADQGCEVRLWPGRYPAKDQPIPAGLAPSLKKRMLADPSLRTGYGMMLDRGATTDPDRHDEASHIDKERKSKNGSYELQMLLDVSIGEESRYCLDPTQFVIEHVDDLRAPVEFKFKTFDKHAISISKGLYKPYNVSTVTGEYSRRIAFIDPAFTGSDRTVITIGYLQGKNVWIPDQLQIAGGWTEKNMYEMVSFLIKFPLDEIFIETNNGGNALTTNLTRSLIEDGNHIKVTAHHTAGKSKEQRISDTLAPLMGLNRIILSPKLIDHDTRVANDDSQRSLLFQAKYLTLTKGALKHDDAIDSLSLLCEMLAEDLNAASCMTPEEQQSINYQAMIRRRNGGSSTQNLYE